MSESQYFQKGFNLKTVVGPVLAQNYASARSWSGSRSWATRRGPGTSP